MRRLAALPPLLLLLLAVTGCATGGTQPGSPAAAGSSAGSSAEPSSGPSAGACGSGRVTLTEQDNRRQACVTAGTLVQVYLHGKPDQMWSGVSSDAPALRPVATGRGALPIGVTGGFFRADGAGTARLTSSRPMCPSPPPGGARCLALEGFTVTVEVR